MTNKRNKFHFVANLIAFKMNTNFGLYFNCFLGGKKSHCPLFSDTVCTCIAKNTSHTGYESIENCKTLGISALLYVTICEQPTLTFVHYANIFTCMYCHNFAGI